LFSNVPNLDPEVISSEDVVIVSRSESSPAHRRDNVGEEMLLGGVLLDLKGCRVFAKI
jgi:hypothetical protein